MIDLMNHAIMANKFKLLAPHQRDALVKLYRSAGRGWSTDRAQAQTCKALAKRGWLELDHTGGYLAQVRLTESAYQYFWSRSNE